MEMSLPLDQEHCAKYLHFAMDYDSGYISHNAESNLDSSSEHLNEILKDESCHQPVYLSEDALLEKPEVRSRFFNLSTEIDNEDYEETRNLFNSSDIGNEVVPESVESREISYSGFNTDSDISDIEIPRADKIFVNNSSLASVPDNNNDSVDQNEEKAVIEGNNSCWKDDEGFKGFPLNQKQPVTAFSNITNTLATSDPKKKLTLIFSKCDKENLYSVKRKYRSLTPDRSLTAEELQVLPDVPKDVASSEVDVSVCSDQKEGVSDRSIEENCVDIEESKVSPEFTSCQKEYSFSETFSRNFIFNQECEQSVTANDDEEHVVPKMEEVPDVEVKIRAILPDNPELCEQLDFTKSEEKETSEQVVESDLKNGGEKALPQPPKTPVKKYQSTFIGSATPDLFEDEEVERELQVSMPPPTVREDKYIHKKDKTILRRVQNNLKGVIPPHSITVMHISVDEILNRLDLNKDYFWTSSEVGQKSDDSVVSEPSQSMNISGSISDDSSLAGTSKSLLVSCALEDCINKKFPDILKDRCHGLYHNCSKLSEEFEDLCTKYGQRYVGAETQSTCSVFESNCVSPTKRKQIKQRWAAKSPGRRLSHLARRRITFSSINLQTGNSFAGSRARQILVDTKNLDRLRRRSPKKSPKKTPSKSPRMKTRTPSSSAKKKLAIRFRKLTGEIEKTNNSSDNPSLSSKRALFTSPDCDKKSSLFMPSTSGLSALDHEVKRPSTKRALFMSPNRKSPMKRSPFKRSPFGRSPFKRSPFKRLDAGADKKRKRTESEDGRPAKQPKSQPEDARPSTSEHKSTDWSRRHSTVGQTPAGELSAVHKKKLQWAVYEALRSQNVAPTHAQFKVFASVLARLTRRFLPNLSANAPRPEGGTSERMLRIARHHVFSVIKGKSVDEIYNEYVKSRAKQLKPQGYVSLEEFIERENKENSFDCRAGSQTSALSQRSGASQRSVSSQGSGSSSQRSGCSQKSGMSRASSASSENKIERIRKVINFGDDNR